MKNGRQLVYPRVAFDKNGQITTWDKEFQGLSKREYFAGLAMQGLLTRSDGNPQLGILESKRIADESVVIADALLKELEKNGSI